MTCSSARRTVVAGTGIEARICHSYPEEFQLILPPAATPLAHERFRSSYDAIQAHPGSAENGIPRHIQLTVVFPTSGMT